MLSSDVGQSPSALTKWKDKVAFHNVIIKARCSKSRQKVGLTFIWLNLTWGTGMLGIVECRFETAKARNSQRPKLSDGSQPPMTLDLSVRESAGSRSLNR
jgi:hypothetical protein